MTQNDEYYDFNEILKHGKDREIEFVISPRGTGRLKDEMMNNDIGQDN